jgi:hypothetical protein
MRSETAQTARSRPKSTTKIKVKVKVKVKGHRASREQGNHTQHRPKPWHMPGGGQGSATPNRHRASAPLAGPYP